MSAGSAPGLREARLERFGQELARWGERMNLVGCTSREAIGVHIDDALAAADQLPAAARVVDLGSGAGFPGIPLAIARPDLHFTLVEARERRVHFLRHVLRVLEIAAEVRCERFERSAPARYDVACMRGVGPLPQVLEPASGWLAPGGELWLWTKLEGPELGVLVRGRVELGAERGRVVRLAPAHSPAAAAAVR